MTLLLGDCLERLKELPNNSTDSCVTDPPYGLSFMNKHWDAVVPGVEIWREVYRVLKPGGHLLSFGGTRTYHHMAMNVELAGFEIRDQIQWLYGSGFPKSQNVAIQIDKQAGAIGHRGRSFSTAGKGTRSDLQDAPSGWTPETTVAHEAVTDEAKAWQGWGTALKPANEPIVLARKPLEKGLTVAANVQKWGTGAINVDAGRIGSSKRHPGNYVADSTNSYSDFGHHDRSQFDANQGRWPANVLFDEDAAKMLDEQSGVSRSPKTYKRNADGLNSNSYGKGMGEQAGKESLNFGDSGGASRFFYCAKASKSERNAGLEGMPERGGSRNFNDGMEYRLQADGTKTSAVQLKSANHHPTVKPIKLMEYLIKLITPPNGTVLDPFMGSGSTGVAAYSLGFKFIGIELNDEYFEIAGKRIEAYKKDA